MIANLRNWFLALSRREQWLVAIAGGLAAWLVLIFGILLPVMTAIDSAKLELDEAVQRRGRIEATVENASRQKPVGIQASSSDIDLVVTQSASEQGLDLLKSASAAPGQISFRIDQARAPALLAWLSGLEAQNIEVVSISLRGGTSGSLTVDAQLRRTGQ